MLGAFKPSPPMYWIASRLISLLRRKEIEWLPGLYQRRSQIELPIVFFVVVVLCVRFTHKGNLCSMMASSSAALHITRNLLQSRLKNYPRYFYFLFSSYLFLLLYLLLKEETWEGGAYPRNVFPFFSLPSCAHTRSADPGKYEVSKNKNPATTKKNVFIF